MKTEDLKSMVAVISVGVLALQQAHMLSGLSEREFEAWKQLESARQQLANELEERGYTNPSLPAI